LGGRQNRRTSKYVLDFLLGLLAVRTPVGGVIAFSLLYALEEGETFVGRSR
jgi:hypothetical protein